MENKDIVFDNEWPVNNLESLAGCPMCSSGEKKLLHSNVEDWAFKCAPGKWNYWLCKDCHSVYLNPRPTASTIGDAYSSYYTHTSASEIKSGLLNKLRNECYFHWFGDDNKPRLNLKHGIKLLAILKPLMPRKFPLDKLEKIEKKGDLLDVGCGNGDLLLAAKKMGWNVRGIEIDAKAVEIAKSKDLLVQQASFDIIYEYQMRFDCIFCSHVLEHVHNPRSLLRGLVGALKPGGVLFIAYPNPKSIVRQWFGRYWRGLEAPRHLCLPSIDSLKHELVSAGINKIEIYSTPIHTFEESFKLKYYRSNIFIKTINKFIYIVTLFFNFKYNQDIIEIKCGRIQK